MNEFKKNFDCNFCNIRNFEGKHEYIDTPIFEDDNFYVISTIGAFLDDWALVVSKEHKCSMRKEYDTRLFDFLSKFTKSLMTNENDSFLCFEHGANKFGSITACGTDHAHIHIIKNCRIFDLDREVNGKLWVETSAEKFASLVEDEEYLAFWEYKHSMKTVEVMVNIVDIPESQYFRKILALRNSIYDYDYNKNTNLGKSIDNHFRMKEVISQYE